MIIFGFVIDIRYTLLLFFIQIKLSVAFILAAHLLLLCPSPVPGEYIFIPVSFYMTDDHPITGRPENQVVQAANNVPPSHSMPVG